MVLDLRTRRARVDGRSVDLTAREFTLLELFMRHPGQVLSREQILAHVWGYDFDPGSNIVDVYVRALRRKLGEGTSARCVAWATGRPMSGDRGPGAAHRPGRPTAVRTLRPAARQVGTPA